MKEKAIFIGDLHFEHEMWKRELLFCKDELNFLTNRLEEVVIMHDEPELMREVEHFQNQFILQNQNIDQFTHDINKKEHELAVFAKDHPVAIDHVHFDDHTKLRNNMEGFAKTYNIMKQEFRVFIAKWK
ncbi:MAG: hypothetical protein CL840_16095 [Crocinitomicaceae bacterium]|nr:hypothetical protein [Crocinitomicaceae bacterium]|tara:strand:+ start:11645 stop:12031 length:387 start_codon:yes stop_codon:yes gene_type:complete